MSRPRIGALLLGLALLCVAALPAPASAKGAGPLNVRCVDVKDARPERIGVSTLLLRTELERFEPKADDRVRTMRLELLDETKAAVDTLEVPLGKLRAAFGPLFSGGPDVKSRKGTMRDNFFADAVSLSDDGKTLGLSLRGPGEQGVRQNAIVFWTIGTGRVVVAKAVFQRERKEKANFSVLGHDATGGLLVLDSRTIDAGSGRHVLDLLLRRIDPASAKVSTVWKLRTAPRRNDRMYAGSHIVWSRDRKRVAIPEYLEDPDGEAAVHVVDVMTGKHRELPAPATTYGLAFSDVGNKLAIGSNRLGVVRLVDLESGAVEHEAKGFKHIHKLVYGRGSTFLYVGQKAGDVVQLRGATLARQSTSKAWTAKKLVGGTLYGQLPPASDPRYQSFGRTPNKHGFGTLDRICVVGM